jgi:hypothetical protein
VSSSLYSSYMAAGQPRPAHLTLARVLSRPQPASAGVTSRGTRQETTLLLALGDSLATGSAVAGGSWRTVALADAPRQTLNDYGRGSILRRPIGVTRSPSR